MSSIVLLIGKKRCGALLLGTNATWDDMLSFRGARAGGKWDGFDFTIADTSSPGTLRFNLGGSLHEDLWANPDYDLTLANSDSYILNGTQAGIEAKGMWIGDHYVPMVNVAEGGLGVYQRFETPAAVPEPATMVLFGVGVAGLAGANRRKKAAVKK